MGIVVVEPGKILSFYFFCLNIFHPGLQWLDLMWSLISEESVVIIIIICGPGP